MECIGHIKNTEYGVLRRASGDSGRIRPVYDLSTGGNGNRRQRTASHDLVEKRGPEGRDHLTQPPAGPQPTHEPLLLADPPLGRPQTLLYMNTKRLELCAIG